MCWHQEWVSSALVVSDETPFSDHLPQGLPLFSAVWSGTGALSGDLMVKLRQYCFPTEHYISACLPVDGQGRRSCLKEVVHLKPWLLIFPIWQPVKTSEVRSNIHALKHRRLIKKCSKPRTEIHTYNNISVGVECERCMINRTTVTVQQLGLGAYI